MRKMGGRGGSFAMSPKKKELHHENVAHNAINEGNVKKGQRIRSEENLVRRGRNGKKRWKWEIAIETRG